MTKRGCARRWHRRRHGVGPGPDELDVPGMRRTQGRFRDGSNLKQTAAQPRDARPLKPFTSGAYHVSTTARFKVLVMDDSNTIRRSAEIFLKQGGHEVCWPKTASMPWPKSTTTSRS